MNNNLNRHDYAVYSDKCYNGGVVEMNDSCMHRCILSKDDMIYDDCDTLTDNDNAI